MLVDQRYLGKHDVFCQGYNEGKGIWGTWEISAERFGTAYRGGFYIWPVGIGDATGQHLYEKADVPAGQEEFIGVWAISLAGCRI